MRAQLLAAENALIGPTNILLIGLPDAWRVARGYAEPELDQWREHAGSRWMSRGMAPYRLVEPHRERPHLVRAEVDFEIRARPVRARQRQPEGQPEQTPPLGRLVATDEVGTVSLAGHEARFAFGRVRLGLFPRREVPALQVMFTCPESGRHLRLVWNASLRDGRVTAGREDLAALLRALSEGIRCH